MALTITLVPGKIWVAGESVTEDKLNQTANPTVFLEGSISSASIADGSVTTVKLANGCLSADAAGRAKMADQYLIASKLGSDVAGDGLSGGAGSAIAVSPDGLTIETSGGDVRLKSTGAGVVADSRNLVVKNNVATPTSKADIAADEVLLKNSTGNPFLATVVSVTADMAVSGAGGLDTGAEAASTWYYLYVIGKTDGTGVAALISASSTAPTMPATYTYKALVGAVRNDGSSNFLAFWQAGREVFVNDTINVVFTAKNGVVAWTALSGADLTAFRAAVPPIAKIAFGIMGNTTAATGIAVASDANGLGASFFEANSAGASLNGYQLGGNWRVGVTSAYLIYYQMSSTATSHRVTVSGFVI